MGWNRLLAAALFSCVSQPIAAQVAACATTPPTAPIVLIGAFSNVRHTSEHSYGETVLLWRSGGCLVGLFESEQGLQGDAPIGELQEVTYNQKGGTLRFAAKLTIGLTVGPGSAASQPSRDFYRFVGRLAATRVSGRLTHVNQLDPKPTTRSVQLTALARDLDAIDGSATYGAWRAKWQPILVRRGPKW